MPGRRIYAGYYRRYDRKVVYVISLATDADTGEESVIWTTYPFADVPKYYTSSKKSFCAYVEVNGERKARYKRLLNIKISREAVERLREERFCDQFVNSLSIRRYADVHQLNRGSVDYQQKKFFSALACLLKERDEAEGTCRLLKPAHK